jgi:hypothetical protein
VSAGVAAAVQVVAAGLLVAAAAAKAAAPKQVIATISALGLPAAPALRVALVATELVAAVALATAPAAPATITLVLGLGVVFAGVGAWAWQRGEEVACACFGGRVAKTLGLRQVAALPVWATAALLPAAGGSELAGADGLLALTAVTVAAGLALAVPVLGEARQRSTAVAS